ncbi:MAG: phosphoserine phosphatase RsbU/P, partial [Solirubrobacteraceae bacterium]|nr:phosphoserine phosphatase RsbU/P [Solirubrobacteraceae bacterium]
FFLGDVCGKGPEAASITSLARYTIRTAAMLREGPTAILANLNAALRMEMEGLESLQMCSVVYGEIDTSARVATVTLAVAGHPAALVVRLDGSIEATRAGGTILGVFSDPAFETCEINLGLGDTIVLYSDGILDTEIDGVLVDEERVAELLSGVPQASAQTLVDRLKHMLHGIERRRDDVAVMALRRTALG